MRAKCPVLPCFASFISPLQGSGPHLRSDPGAARSAALRACPWLLYFAPSALVKLSVLPFFPTDFLRRLNSPKSYADQMTKLQRRNSFRVAPISDGESLPRVSKQTLGSN